MESGCPFIPEIARRGIVIIEARGARLLHRQPMQRSIRCTSVAWSGLGVHNVEIHATYDGWLVFDFPKSPEYSGGAVPLRNDYARLSDKTHAARKRRE